MPRRELPRAMKGEERRDTEAFRASLQQYAMVELDVNERNKVRHVHVFEAWWAQSEGDAGWNGPPRRMLVGLMWVTFELAHLSVMDLALPESLLGCWTFLLQFRRCMFMLVDRLNREGSPSGCAGGCLRLSRAPGTSSWP